MIERVGAGLHVLGKPKAAKPSPSPPPAPDDEAMLLSALERWLVDRSWNTKLGPAPDARDNARHPPAVRGQAAEEARTPEGTLGNSDPQPDKAQPKKRSYRFSNVSRDGSGASPAMSSITTDGFGAFM